MNQLRVNSLRVALALVLCWMFSIYLSSCRKESSFENMVYNSVLEAVLDSLKEEHNLNHTEIVLGRHESEEIINSIQRSINDEFGSDTSGLSKMILRLSEALTDPVYLTIELGHTNYGDISGNTKLKRELSKKIHRGEIQNVAMVNLSKVIYDERSRMGCFYISIDYIKSGGYLVFIAKRMEEWEVLGLLNKWG